MTALVEVSLTVTAPTLADAEREALARLDTIVPGAEWVLSYDATGEEVVERNTDGRTRSRLVRVEWRVHAHLQSQPVPPITYVGPDLHGREDSSW